MFSSRRFLAAFLIVTVLSAGFGLFSSPLVQNASAQSDDLCDYYIETCEGYWDLADLVCQFYGSDTHICYLAKVYAQNWCDHYGCVYCWCA